MAANVRWYQPHDGPAGPPAPPDRGAPPGRRSQGPAVAQALKRWPTTPTVARRWRRRRRSPTQRSRATATGSQATTDSLNEAPRSTRGHLACEESRRDRLAALQNRGHMRRRTRPSAARPAPVGRARRPRQTAGAPRAARQRRPTPRRGAGTYREPLPLRARQASVSTRALEMPAWDELRASAGARLEPAALLHP